MQAGWHDDPSGRHQYRYFDGARWTETVSDNGTTSIDREGIPRTDDDVATLPAPVVSSPFASGPAATPFGSSPIVPPSGKKALWKRPWFLASVAIAVVLLVAVAMAGSGDDADEPALRDGTTTENVAPVDTTDDSIDDDTEEPAADEPDEQPEEEPQPTVPADAEQPEDTQPDPGVPEGSGGPFPVGTTVTVGDDLVRVNSVTANAPPDDFFQPPAGTTVTAVEVEACGGGDGFQANSLYWRAFLDDNTSADIYIFGDDFQTVGLRPGACIRGVVSYQVPDGRTVASVVFLGPLFDEMARWAVDGAVPVTDRLQPARPVDAVPVGTTAEFGAGHTAVVRSVVDAAPPLDDFFPPAPGRQYHRIDVELCAGSEPLLVNPLSWLGTSTDSWMAGAGIASQLPALSLASGQCVAGLVELDFPAGSVTDSIVLTDGVFDEVVRWSVG